jgi:hypothetical protein
MCRFRSRHAFEGNQISSGDRPLQSLFGDDNHLLDEANCGTNMTNTKSSAPEFWAIQTFDSDSKVKQAINDW